VHGEHAQGTFYVPLATTEGALVRSYERGMVAVTRAGGAFVRVMQDENRATPAFSFGAVEQAVAFARELPALVDELRRAAEATTRHGKLLRIEPRVAGLDVLVGFVFSTGDASGMNIVGRATAAACALLVERFEPRGWTMLSGAENEKQAGPGVYFGGKGKSVVAGARLSPALVRQVLGVEPAAVAAYWRRCVVAQAEVGAVGINGQFANALAALFIACGQDVANVANSAVGVLTFELADDGGLAASVHLPSLVVATVGGGTTVGAAPECLGILGCVGDGKARKLAEIVGATLLAGEISLAASLVAGDHVEAHDRYGRRPAGDAKDPAT
jgi:hydroxymethylglutaryl-CoA reductase (NADPH)